VIRYTTDGSEPTGSSKKYDPVEAITVKDGMTVEARCFWPNGQKSLVIEKTFKKVKPVPAKAVKIKHKGLVYAEYTNDRYAMPDISKMKPVRRGVIERLDLDLIGKKSPGQDHFALHFSGYINVPKTGVYTFTQFCEDGALLTISGRKVVGGHKGHPNYEERGDIALQAGWHPLELDFFEEAYHQQMIILYEGPGIDRQEIPADSLGIDKVDPEIEYYLRLEPKSGLLTTVVRTGESDRRMWRFTTDTPPKAWATMKFNDREWTKGKSPFAGGGTPWRTSDIWIRKSFTLDSPVAGAVLRIRHDEDVEVYINGRLVCKRLGYINSYINIKLPPDSISGLVKGKNVIAIHCHQTTGGQYIDAGLMVLYK